MSKSSRRGGVPSPESLQQPNICNLTLIFLIFAISKDQVLLPMWLLPDLRLNVKFMTCNFFFGEKILISTMKELRFSKSLTSISKTVKLMQ
jgi:hypothetical protein